MPRMNGDIGFDEDIKALFTDGDRACMKARGLDLENWRVVRTKAAAILDQVTSGKMPLGNPWPDERVELFGKWIAEGCPKWRGAKYSEYFAEIDNNTEYETPPGSGLMNAARVVMPFFRETWWEYAPLAGTPDGNEELEILQEDLSDDDRLRDALLAVDSLLVSITKKHFEIDGELDTQATIDAFEQFGRDMLPPDKERGDNFPTHFDPGFHRMDSTSMWFNWAAQLECAHLVIGEDENTPVRHAMLCGLCVGSQMDFVFREDGHGAPSEQSNPRAKPQEGLVREAASERKIRRRGQRALRSWSRASDLIHSQVAAYVS